MFSAVWRCDCESCLSLRTTQGQVTESAFLLVQRTETAFCTDSFLDSRRHFGNPRPYWLWRHCYLWRSSWRHQWRFLATLRGHCASREWRAARLNCRELQTAAFASSHLRWSIWKKEQQNFYLLASSQHQWVRYMYAFKILSHSSIPSFTPPRTPPPPKYPGLGPESNHCPSQSKCLQTTLRLLTGFQNCWTVVLGLLWVSSCSDM